MAIDPLPEEEVEDPNQGSGKFYYSSGATYEGEWVLATEDARQNPPYPPPFEPPPLADGKDPSHPPPPNPPPYRVRPNRQRHGKGVYIDGAYQYNGEWQHDFMHGQGCFKYASGSSYHGQWENNIYMGLGTYIWPNGAKYIGGWRENRMHGDGTYIDKDGNIWTGQFFNGKGPGLVMEIK